MLECQVGMQSDTLARKAQSMCLGYGYQCKIQRNLQKSAGGCNYRLTVNGDCNTIASLLSKHDIPYQSLRNLRDGG